MQWKVENGIPPGGTQWWREKWELGKVTKKDGKKLCTMYSTRRLNLMLEDQDEQRILFVNTACPNEVNKTEKQVQKIRNSVRPHLIPYHLLCNTCVTNGKPCCSIGHQILPIQPLPREAEDFPRGGKYLKDVPLPTYLN